MSKFAADRFHNEESARKFLETVRWPDGPTCPHCGSVNKAYENASKPGVYRCGEPQCRKDFSVTVGTLFERSHVPLHKWLLATHLLMSSKKGFSAHQLHRTLEVTYKTAWFMAMRIREGLRPLFAEPPMGGEGKFVEVDEAYIGGSEKNKHMNKRTRPGKSVAGSVGKEPAVSLVERGGKVRSFHMPTVNSHNVRQVLTSQIDPKTSLRTDESGLYKRTGREFADHATVHHSAAEYVRGDAHGAPIASICRREVR